MYLCPNAPHAAADVVLRTVAPCTANTAADSGGAPGAGILGRRRPAALRPKKRPTTSPPISVVIKDVAPLEVIVDEPMITFLRHRQEDDLVALGLI